MISILIPSRGRFSGLLKAVHSFYDKAGGRDFEILIKLDSDDHESIRRIGELEQFGANVHTVVAPRLRGYFDLNKFYNCLAALASGKWLWLFNDDAQVVTPGWDTLIYALANSAAPAFAWPHVEWDYPQNGQDSSKDMAIYSKEFHYDFPVISRGAYDAMGHFSMSNLNDVYIFDVGQRFQHLCHVPKTLVVSHTYLRDETHPHGMKVEDALVVHYGKAVQRHVELAVQRISAVL
jgi:hypothetical protein